MAYEGAVDESSFVAGPVLVSTIAALASPTVGLLLALLVAVVAQGGFGLHHSALPGRSTASVTADTHPSGPLPRLHLAGLLLAMAAIGLVFGSSQTGVAARLDGLGRDELDRPGLRDDGVGSAVAGLLTTRLPRGFGLAAADRRRRRRPGRRRPAAGLGDRPAGAGRRLPGRGHRARRRR